MTVNPILISRPPTAATAEGPAPLLLGQRGYAYGIVADRFAAMLAARDVTVIGIDYPEQYKHAAFAEAHGLKQGEHLHLIFRDSEQIRTIAGAYNVAWFAWSFDALKQDGSTQELILRDQVRMLRACDEVWVPSTHAQRVLRDHGVTATYVVPAPIPVPDAAADRGGNALGSLARIEAVPLVTLTAMDEAGFARIAKRQMRRLGSTGRVQRAIEAGNLFVTVCDPTDRRKNLVSLIEGFLIATAGRDDTVLLVKLVNWGAMENPPAYLFHQIRALFGHPHCLHEESVLFFSGALSDEEMAELFAAADFYVSASIGEGQNLPLLEAMACGSVPVTVRNTAMADYVDDAVGVVIQEGRYPGIVPGMSPELAHMRVATSFADRFQIADAIGRALALDESARDARRGAARARVAERYTSERVFAALTARLAIVRPSLNPAVPALPTVPPAPEVADATDTAPRVENRPAGGRWWR